MKITEGITAKHAFLGVPVYFYGTVTRPFCSGKAIWARDWVQLEEAFAHELRAHELGHQVNRPWDVLPGVVIL